MYEFWYDSVKQKCSKKAKLCHINTDNLIVYMKADDIYKDIAEDVDRFDTWNYEVAKPLPKGKKCKAIWLMIDEFGRKIMTRFVGLWAKIYT